MNLVAGKSSVGAIPTGLRKRRQSVANTGAAGGGAATGRRGSSASGGSDGVSILGGGGAPEPNWQKAVKLTVVNTFFPPIHGGKQLEAGCNRVSPMTDMHRDGTGQGWDSEQQLPLC